MNAYIGGIIGFACIIVSGVLVTQGWLDGIYASSATTFLLGIIGGATVKAPATNIVAKLSGQNDPGPHVDPAAKP